MKKIVLLLLLSSPFVSIAQSWEDTVRAIDKIFERYKPSNPGIQVAISRNGKLLYSKAWGLADLEHNAALTTTSPSEAGSVSKQFTAAAILLLEQQGKLSLNDDIRKYLPELKNYGYTITLRHMMQHTSGLKDWGAVAALAGWPRSTKTYDNNDALYIVSMQQTLNNIPGAEFIYSNSNYNLLAIVVQRVSGMSLNDFTKKNIFEPAGMTHTTWRYDHRNVVPNRAIAYSKDGRGYFANMPNEYVYGNGGLLTTAEDLTTWTNYYTSGKFGSPALFKTQTTTHRLNNGNRNVYAAGLFVSAINGIEMIAHDGATAGYRANLEYFPKTGVTIAWLSNTTEFELGNSVSGALRNIFAKPAEMGVKDVGIVNVPKTTLESYTGWYRNSRTGGGVRLSMDGDNLKIGNSTLEPTGDRKFEMGNNRLLFYPDHRKNGFMFINADNDSTFFGPVDVASTNLNEYVGEYYSAEAEAKYSIISKDGKLYIQQKPKPETQLTVTYKDGFEYPGCTMYFERDRNGKIINFKVSISRARNVEFKKIQ